MRCTLLRDSPTSLAIPRVDQWVASLGFSSKVLISTRSTISPVIVGGTPERYSSANPGRRSRWKRPRHLHTVCGNMPTFPGHRLVGLALGTGEHDPRAHGQGLRGARAACPSFQRLPLLTAEFHRCGRSASSGCHDHHHHRLPQITQPHLWDRRPVARGARAPTDQEEDRPCKSRPGGKRSGSHGFPV